MDAPIEAIEHDARRSNIPTQELAPFMEDEERTPKIVMYPRDLSLDPQLVWKKKDEQNTQGLEVPSVPIYVQEEIRPRYIIEDLRREVRQGTPGRATLFDDAFNDIPFEDRIEFYQHEQPWTNRLILGDSLLVMTSLADKEGLKNSVQTIFFDPPYGIKFGSNWQISVNKRDVKDGKEEDLTRQPEQIKAFRDTWELGIHSYLAYLRDRFVVANELLTESGSIFVQIGDDNAHLVRSLLDEAFGSENYIATINYNKTSGQTARYLSVTTDYILWYAKDATRMKYRPQHVEKTLGGMGAGMYQFVELEDGTRRRLTMEEVATPAILPKNVRPFRFGDVTSQRQNRPSGPGTAMSFPVELDGKSFTPPGARGWSTTQEGMKRLRLANRLVQQGERLTYVRYLNDFSAIEIDNNWTDMAGVGDRVYVVQTSTEVVKRCILMTSNPGDLVLDPTCGSGTTAFVAEQWGRRWITIDTSRVAVALARTRLISAKYPCYLLVDSPEGARREAAYTGKAPVMETTRGDIKKGFVCKRIPHIALRSIANNTAIDTVHAKWTALMDATRTKINVALETTWEDWQMPPVAMATWPTSTLEFYAEWQRQRRERQKAIDEVILQSAESTVLHDQPLEDNKKMRISGPFTVESLSPHRVLPTDEELPYSEAMVQSATGNQFVKLVLEHLKTAGVQNTVKDERLTFERLDFFAGKWLHAEGEYTENGKRKRVAVCIGPEYGTVGPDLLRDAAKEAMEGVSFDILVICGFSFDPHVGEAKRKYGKLTVMTTQMNSELLMGEGVLKNTGVGNMFTYFGEPDIDVTEENGKLKVEIRGVDIFDPTTGAVKSDTTDKIACWFIDTNYNGEIFLVRHAYFTGNDYPYEKWKRALRSEIDEGAWAALYSNVSRPFDLPPTGKIAVKIINLYGDEVLKVHEVAQPGA